jgi:hypothetical protein
MRCQRITVVSLFAALVMRVSNPAQRIISTFDDYISWLVTSCRCSPASSPPAISGPATKRCFRRTSSASHVAGVAALRQADALVPGFRHAQPDRRPAQLTGARA